MGMLHELLRRTGRWRQSAAVPFRPWEMARTRCLPSAPTAFVGPQRRASGAPRLGTPARLPYQRAYRLLYDPCLPCERWVNGEPQGTGCFQVEHHLHLATALERQLARLCALEDVVNEDRRTRRTAGNVR